VQHAHFLATASFCYDAVGSVATNVSAQEVIAARQSLDQASDFSLTDTQGNTVRLSQFRGCQHVVLVFNRGFT
jgi:hypothetical protein